MRRRYLCGALVAVIATVAALSAAAGQAAIHSSLQPTKTSVMRVFKGKPLAKPSRTNNLSYRGGVGGIGVETAPKVYLVLWGSQWGTPTWWYGFPRVTSLPSAQHWMPERGQLSSLK